MSTTLEWFKSSYSGDEGGQCLEVAFNWRKSSYSGSNGGNCVEVATTPATVHVRDSKVEDGPVLDLGPASWAALTGWVSA
ncbi:DUF397 domain-containing protein [Streptomyces sp. C]|uniref:DUF397 domain-containing protein n=1 Tax=Streptomyces sp. C TaxID=253839 RepID=UPI0001B58263|nr:DUF397 domain-containing protein [Streptomyces sp. C]EFL15815.1 conserved hypothetical protein [Streptomyces sp. C]